MHFCFYHSRNIQTAQAPQPAQFLNNTIFDLNDTTWVSFQTERPLFPAAAPFPMRQTARGAPALPPGQIKTASWKAITAFSDILACGPMSLFPTDQPFPKGKAPENRSFRGLFVPVRRSRLRGTFLGRLHSLVRFICSCPRPPARSEHRHQWAAPYIGWW